MKDIMGMMKKAQELQSKMGEMQESLGNLIVEGRSGGGMVVISLSGKGDLKGVKIDPSLLVPGEADILEDLLVAAHADAKGKAEAEMQAKMGQMTEGLPLPPGMKFPF